MTRAPSLRACAALLVAVPLLGLSDCALTSRGATLTPRYFSPNVAEPAHASPATPAPAAEPALRLGQVEAASHLEERMAYRVSPAELGYYEDRRWTEQPYEYLRRALERELFENRHVRRVVTGAADTLDVELTAFEELRTPQPHVRLALTFTLHDERESLLERSVVVERALPAGDDAGRAERVAQALGAALGAAVTQVSDAVVPTLHAAPAAPCEGESAEPAREARQRPGR